MIFVIGKSCNIKWDADSDFATNECDTLRIEIINSHWIYLHAAAIGRKDALRP